MENIGKLFLLHLVGDSQFAYAVHVLPSLLSALYSILSTNLSEYHKSA